MAATVEFTAGRENGRRRPRGYADWRPQAKTKQLLADIQDVLDRYEEHLPLTIRRSEAAGMAGQLARVASDYSIPVYSAGGFASLTATRMIADRALDSHVPTLLLHVGDFDPSGESIFASITEDAAAFVRTDAVIPVQQRLDAQRVALTAAQVQEFDLPTAPAKDSSHARGWAGGTCQLEALPPDVLAGIVRDAIEDRLDLDRYHREVDQEREDRAELLGLPRGGDA